MTNNQKKLLSIYIIINLGMFIYYCILPDINPSNDAYYYLSIADSYYNGTGFCDITGVEPNPIITPQNGVVFIHILLRAMGWHDPGIRFLIIKIINYIGFLFLVLVFYETFKKLKVSSEITIICMGIILLSAHFLKTIIAPLNDGIFCILTALVFYLVIINDKRQSFKILAIITFLSIVLANFRLNGPLIILAASITYYLVNNRSKALIYLIIFCISYAMVYVVLVSLQVDFSAMKELTKNIYSWQFIIYQALITLIYTIPGAFVGIDGREIMIALPLSIGILIYYILYFRQAWKENNIITLYIIVYILLSITFLQIMPGGPSRYIIMVLPFTYLTLGTYFRENNKLKLVLVMMLLLTFSISLARLVFWDSKYFDNQKALDYVHNNIVKPFILISGDHRYSYYIFNKSADDIKGITKDTKCIVIFGHESFIQAKIEEIKRITPVNHIEKSNATINTGLQEDETDYIVKIIVN